MWASASGLLLGLRKTKTVFVALFYSRNYKVFNCIRPELVSDRVRSWKLVADERRSLKIEVDIAVQIKSDDEVLLLKTELTKFNFISVQVRNKCYVILHFAWAFRRSKASFTYWIWLHCAWTISQNSVDFFEKTWNGLVPGFNVFLMSKFKSKYFLQKFRQLFLAGSADFE